WIAESSAGAVVGVGVGGYLFRAGRVAREGAVFFFGLAGFFAGLPAGFFALAAGFVAGLAAALLSFAGAGGRAEPAAFSPLTLARAVLRAAAAASFFCRARSWACFSASATRTASSWSVTR